MKRNVQRGRQRLALAALGLLALGAQAVPSGAQGMLVVVRHAEQTPNAGGMMDGDPPLNEAGRRRAEALAERLKHAGVTAIYTSQFARARETAAPLAAALKLEPEVVAKDDVPALSGQIKARHGAGTVLVIGHSDTIPAMLKAWGHAAAFEFPRAEFDNAWLIVPREAGPPLVARLMF